MIRPVGLSGSNLVSVDLAELAESLRAEDAYGRSGRTAASLTRDDDLTVALTVVRAGEEIREHEAPGPVTLIGLSGKVLVQTEAGEAPLDHGRMVMFAADVAHSVVAKEDAAFLIVIGGRTQPRSNKSR